MSEPFENQKLKLDRLLFFSDAVYAIILTLLVLELRPPKLENAGSATEMWHRLSEVLPHFFAFLLCFLVIWQGWLAHNTFFSLVNKYDNNLGAINIGLLMPYCLLPFAAMMIGDYPHNPISFVVFGGLNLLGSLGAILIMHYTLKRGMLVQEAKSKAFEDTVIKGSYAGPFILLIGIGAAFFSTIASFIFFGLLFIFYIIMMQRFTVKLKA